MFCSSGFPSKVGTCSDVSAGRRKWCKPPEEDPDSHLFSRDGWLLPLCYEKGGVLATNELVSPWGFQCCLICLLERSVLCLPDLPSQSDLKKKKWHANVFFSFPQTNQKTRSVYLDTVFYLDIICYGSRKRETIMKQWLDVEGKIGLMRERVEGCILMEEYM